MIKYGIKFLEDNKTYTTAIQKDLFFKKVGGVDSEGYQERLDEADAKYSAFESSFDEIKDDLEGDPQYIKHDGSKSYFDSDGEAEAKESERLAKNKAEALAYQDSQQSQNELGILHGYSVTDLDEKPIAKDQVAWMTSLFALKNLKDADPTNDTPLSSVGNKPHSFEEIYAEKWGL